MWILGLASPDPADDVHRGHLRLAASDLTRVDRPRLSKSAGAHGHKISILFSSTVESFPKFYFVDLC